MTGSMTRGTGSTTRGGHLTVVVQEQLEMLLMKVKLVTHHHTVKRVFELLRDVYSVLLLRFFKTTLLDVEPM